MNEKIWVKAANAKAQFYQEVDNGRGGVTIEHVIAPTQPEEPWEQIPAPMQVTQTVAVNRALMERDPDTKLPARIVLCSDEEVGEWLKAHPEFAPAPADPAKKGGKA